MTNAPAVSAVCHSRTPGPRATNKKPRPSLHRQPIPTTSITSTTMRNKEHQDQSPSQGKWEVGGGQLRFIRGASRRREAAIGESRWRPQQHIHNPQRTTRDPQVQQRPTAAAAHSTQQEHKHKHKQQHSSSRQHHEGMEVGIARLAMGLSILRCTAAAACVCCAFCALCACACAPSHFEV